MPLKHDWANRAYLGLTASTGALADNHDILSLSTYSDHEVMELAEEEKAAKREFPLSLKSSTPDRLIAIENQLDAILKRFNTLDHHLEHELVAVEDHISNLGSKINKREDSSEGRIEMLEETMTRKVDGTIAERLNHIERQLKGTVDRKITNVADNLERKLDVKVSKSAASNAASAANAQIDSSNGDWKIPFLMLFLLFVAGAIGFYRFYEKMKRSHIL